MATTSIVELHVPGNAIDKSAHGSSSESQHEDIEMKSRVDAMWEQMNKGVSSTTLKSLMNEPSPTVNKISSKKSNKWITYLGLAPKEMGSISQDAAQNGQNGIGDDDKKINAMWEKMNEGVPKRTFKSFPSMPSSSMARTWQTISNNWLKNLAFAQRKTESAGQDVPLENGIFLQKRSSVMQGNASDEAKRIAAAALSTVKEAAAAAASGRGKVGIGGIRDFAGQEIEVKKFVEADSKEASEKAKAPTSAVDAVLEQIKKKPKLSVLDKTKKDWGEFKEEQKLEEELAAYKKSSNQYLDKVSFLQRTDYREFERERDARLALQARRRSDMREEP